MKKALIFSGYSLSYGFTIVFLIVFLHALWRGDYRFAIDINHFGEAIPELFLFLACFSVITVGLYYTYREYKQEKVLR